MVLGIIWGVYMHSIDGVVVNDMDNVRMGGKPWNITQHNLVWKETCVAGSLNGAFSERVPGYAVDPTWSKRCAIYDPKLKRVTYLEYR